MQKAKIFIHFTEFLFEFGIWSRAVDSLGYSHHVSEVRDVIYSYPLFGFVYEGQPAGPALGYGAHQPFYRADVVGGLFVRKNMIWPLLLMEFVARVPRLYPRTTL